MKIMFMFLLVSFRIEREISDIQNVSFSVSKLSNVYLCKHVCALIKNINFTICNADKSKFKKDRKERHEN